MHLNTYKMERKDKVNVADITDFDELLELVKVDADLVNDLTDEQVTEMRKRLNPYGRTIEGGGTFTCLSALNLSEAYMKRFLMTSLIGFLYRACDEYELDEGEPVCHMDDYDEFMRKYESALSDARESETWLKEHTEEDDSLEFKATKLNHHRRVERGKGYGRRLVVRQFLDGMFEFNPDKHVRSAYSDNPLDPERVTPAQIKRKNKKVIVGKSGSTMEVERANSELVKHIPPADTFHRYSTYIDNNYEEIRGAVTDLYCEKPDLEFAINPYNQFENQEDAEKFVKKHQNEVIADILTLHNSKWNLCGSFKKNRERVNFYNERTAVLEEIFKTAEQDKKLGADMMRKRVARKKDKNVKESGPDPEAFKQYKKDHPSGFESMGAENVLGEQKRDTTEDEVTFKVHEECPYDAVQVDVFDFRKGGQEVTKSEFFTQAEDPVSLE